MSLSQYVHIFQKASKEDKLSCYGYLRNLQKQIYLPVVPLIIKTWIVLFYQQNEKFDPKNKAQGLAISDQATITKITGPPETHAYGMNRINPSLRPIHEWTIRIVKNMNPMKDDICIGITTDDKPPTTYAFMDNVAMKYDNDDNDDKGDYKEMANGDAFNTGSEVRLIFDSQKGSLLLAKDPYYHGGFTNVRPNQTYKLFVTLCSKNNSVTITNYKNY